MEHSNSNPQLNRPQKITKENFSQQNKTRKGRFLLLLRTILCLLASSLLISFSSYSLVEPNKFTTGGVSGIAVLLHEAVSIKQSIVLFSLNLPLLILAFIFVKRKFAILSATNVLLQTMWLVILENVFKDSIRITYDGTGERIFAALAAGICIGAAVALAFKVGGSTGGTDILAVLIQRKISANSIAWIIFICNAIIISSSFFVYTDGDIAMRLLPVMMAIFETYIESKTNDSITNGFHSAIEFRIITDKPDEMAEALMHELSRGVTAMPATGMYTKAEHTMLVCVISRRQVTTLRRIMQSVDPDSFAVMSSVSQVLGLGFYTSEV